MLSEDSLLEIQKLTDIAKEYANLLIDYGGTLYSGVVIDCHNKTFSFSVGPSTHGLSRSVRLPLSIVDEQEKLSVLALEQREKWKKELEDRTCKCCGHIKLDNLCL